MVMPEQKEKSGGLSLQTLLISACAAAAAATIVPLFWQRGTIFATAMTPVLVAVISEALRKPVETVKTVAPKVVTRRAGTGAAVRRYDPDAARTRDHERVGARGEGPERFDPLPPGEEPPVRGDDPFGLRAADKPPITRHWKVAVATGLIAFVIGAGFVTVTELAAGGSVSGGDRRTSVFGGEPKSSTGDTEKNEKSKQDGKDATPTPTATPDDDESATPTPTETPDEEVTPTPTPSVEATPTPTPPAAATPAPTP